MRSRYSKGEKQFSIGDWPRARCSASCRVARPAGGLHRRHSLHRRVGFRTRDDGRAVLAPAAWGFSSCSRCADGLILLPLFLQPPSDALSQRNCRSGLVRVGGPRVLHTPFSAHRTNGCSVSSSDRIREVRPPRGHLTSTHIQCRRSRATINTELAPPYLSVRAAQYSRLRFRQPELIPTLMLPSGALNHNTPITQTLLLLRTEDDVSCGKTKVYALAGSLDAAVAGKGHGQQCDKCGLDVNGCSIACAMI